MPKETLTIRDIAKHIGVSKSAVSAAFTGNGRLSEETRALILKAADEMGFERNLNAQRLQNNSVSNLVGLFTLDLDLSVGTHKVKQIRRLLSRQCVNVQIHSCGYEINGAARELRLLCQQRPCAIICNTTDLPQPAIDELGFFQEKGGVVVCYDRPVNLECDTVEFDRADNTYQAARHLLELGHRRLGFFQIGKDLNQSCRLKGFIAAHREFGLEPRADWLFETMLDSQFEDDGEKMAAYFLALEERPSAVCIVNDFAALAFVAEVQRAGLRVPQDVAVVSHDNRSVARYCSVPLSSVSHPADLIAEKVVELLFHRLQSGANTPFRHEVVRGELVVRASSGAPV